MADAPIKKGVVRVACHFRKEAKVKEVLDAAIKNTDLGRYMTQVLIPTQKVYTTRKWQEGAEGAQSLPGVCLYRSHTHRRSAI